MFSTQKGEIMGINKSKQNYCGEYRQKINNILLKLNKFQDCVEKKNQEQYGRIMSELSEVESNLSMNFKENKQKYDHILNKVFEFSVKVEEKKRQANQFLFHLNFLLDKYSKDYQRLFQKLEKERIETEQTFIDTLQSTFQHLSNKYCLKENSKYLQCGQSFQEFQKKMKQYFQDLAKQEVEIRNNFLKTIDRFRLEIKIESENNCEDKILTVMKQIHHEVTFRIKLMRTQREKMENNVLFVLENIFDSITVRNRQSF